MGSGAWDAKEEQALRINNRESVRVDRVVEVFLDLYRAFPGGERRIGSKDEIDKGVCMRAPDRALGSASDEERVW